MTFFVIATIAGLTIYFSSLLREQLTSSPANDPKRVLIPPWFDRLELAMRERGLDARVVVEVTPMKARVLLRGIAKTTTFEEALGPVDARVALAVARLQVHGPITLEEGVLVTTLGRNHVDAWVDDSLQEYAADCAAVVHALVAERRPLERSSTGSAVRDIDERGMRAPSPPVHDAEGAPSGAPVAIPFERE